MFYVILSVTFHLVYFTVRELSILDETIKLISFIFSFEGSMLWKLCKKLTHAVVFSTLKNITCIM